jgi:hypothetical protein
MLDQLHVTQYSQLEKRGNHLQNANEAYKIWNKYDHSIYNIKENCVGAETDQ